MAIFADVNTVADAATSIRAIALYGSVVAAALLSLLWKQELGLYVLTVMLPLQTTRYHLHAFPLGANIVDILLFCSIAGALLRPATPLTKTSYVPRLLLWMSVFYLFSMIRGTFYLGTSFEANVVRFIDYKNMLVMPLLSLAVTLIVRTRRQIAIILALCALTSVAVDFSYLKSSSGRDFGHYSEETRDAGPLGYAGENGLASYVVEITCCLLPLLVLKRRIVMRFGVLLAIVANVSCLLFSYSREAYLAFIAGLLLVALLKMRILLIPLVLCGAAWQVILPSAVQERITMTYGHTDTGQTAALDPSAQERVMLWTDAMTLFRENPVTGTGFMTYAYLNRIGSYRDTHNFYLKMLVETGIAGLLIFIFQLYAFLRLGLHLFRRAGDNFLSLFGLGFAALILATAIVNLFGDRWLFIQVSSNLWILLGCVLCAGSIVAAETPELAPPGRSKQHLLSMTNTTLVPS